MSNNDKKEIAVRIYNCNPNSKPSLYSIPIDFGKYSNDLSWSDAFIKQGKVYIPVADKSMNKFKDLIQNMTEEFNFVSDRIPHHIVYFVINALYGMGNRFNIGLFVITNRFQDNGIDSVYFEVVLTTREPNRKIEDIQLKILQTIFWWMEETLNIKCEWDEFERIFESRLSAVWDDLKINKH
ncbi:hypothetical protein FACS1894191_4300 [Clostridia bacterium]|nr:hypothetical protein FACS1894191_4300 [Clostridia bacterium]